MLPRVPFTFKSTAKLSKDEVSCSFTLSTSGNVQHSAAASITVCRHKNCTEILKKF